MFCPWCGVQTPERAVYCQNCGRQLSTKATPKHAIGIEKRHKLLEGHVLGRVAYWEGYPPWGSVSISGRLIVAPPYLVFKSNWGDAFQMALFDPGGGRMRVSTGTVEKRGFGRIISDWGITDFRHDALWVWFFDELGDQQLVRFRCSNRREAVRLVDEIERAIYEHRRR
jgi:hypothetical protein